MRRAVIPVAIVAAVALIFAIMPSATAQTVPVTFSGAVQGGEVITLECPAGYQVQFVPSGPVASATYYRDPGLHAVVASGVPPDAVAQYSVSWTVPARGVRSLTATVECQLIMPAPTSTTVPPSTTATTTVPTTSTTTTP
jgi:hypothetical protein